MTGDDLYKYHWKAMETVEVVWENRIGMTVVQCAILVIDFKCHTMKLVPVSDIGYEEKEFWCAITLIRKIKRNQKLTLSKS